MSDILANTWSPVDSNNNNAPPNGMPEGQLPGSVNDGARQHRGAFRREAEKKNATLTTGGTGNNYTLTYPVAPTQYWDGDVFVFKTDRANTGAATLNVNGLGQLAIRNVNGLALVANDIRANRVYSVGFKDNLFQLISPDSNTVRPSRVTSNSGLITVTTSAGTDTEVKVGGSIAFTNLGGAQEIAVSVSGNRDIQFRTVVGAGAADVRTNGNNIIVSAKIINNNNQLTNGAGFITNNTNSLTMQSGGNSWSLPTLSGTTGQYLKSNGNANTAEWTTLPLVLTQYYESPNTGALGSLLNVGFLHGLGGVPRSVQLSFVCVVADGGYSIGDEVTPHGWQTDFDQHNAVSVWWSATQVGASRNRTIRAATKLGATDGNNFAVLSSTNWRYKFRAMR